MTAFKFEKYAYQPDPEFDDFEFIKFSELKDKTITFGTHIRFNDDESVKMTVIVDGKEFCTYTKAKAITRTLRNIYDEIGTIPTDAPVRIGTYSTGKGNDGFCFKDVE